MSDEARAARSLLSARAVRERAHEMLALCEEDGLAHWRYDASKMQAIAEFTLAVMRENYPDLHVPFHARWRHFVVAGEDRWAARAAHADWTSAAARARSEFDLAIVSVLLDAGAGPDWRYRDSNGQVLARSEGLAIASLDMFAAGLFSRDRNDLLRADAARLATITDRELADGFQSSDANPLVGLAGRTALLNALGRACLAAPDAFARNESARPGGLYDRVGAEKVGADDVLRAVLDHLGPIWPSRLSLGGVALGDCWRHPAIRRADATNGLAPFHKLSQWLTYSLIEPLQRAGTEVTGVDALTGLPEYRNGGLFVDFGALVPRNADQALAPQTVASAFIVEWRALTVALLDRTAETIRQKLGRDANSLPLACVLEGGTWAAGRRIAAARRADGAPPLQIVSDGTVF
ncbi:MAG: URC4/urg3 family protein [Hyphomicrobiales bacterium]|nr:URC4/urg3 family protein [Hyphomicrobiales bacterium]